MLNFNLNCFLDSIKELARADELERALWLSYNLPAYYRMNPPQELLDLRSELQAKMCTPRDYVNFIDEINETPEQFEWAKNTLRYQILKIDMDLLNKENLKPHLVNFGPGSFWMERGLKTDGFKFSITPLFLNNKAFESIKEDIKDLISEVPKDQPVIYNATEIIEHLWQEDEIRYEMLKVCGLADIIHCSTPYCTYDVGLKSYKDRREYGHFRALTPNEFLNTLVRMFPEYNIDYYESQIMHCRLTLKEQRFKNIQRFQIDFKETNNPYKMGLF